jgi:putative oxidoreductase
MKTLLFQTDGQWAGFILRMAVGLIMFPHGAQKMLGLFGGYGFKGTMHFFTNNLGFPWIIAFLVILIEFAGAFFLVVGFASRVWSLGFIVIMAGAILTTNYQHGFFMNWFGNQNGEGYEYHLLVIGICLVLLVSGSGKYSIDEWLADL